MIGETIAHYRVVEKLGEGGMGVVYKALDLRLGRAVALKFLPASAGRDALERFEREAHAASSLNHPNILTVHEFGDDVGRRFIATELVDGVSLRERLTGEPLTPAEAIRISEQIASGLVAAHEAGIIHRDIKPENVMLRRDGLVKLVDFGLAKLVEEQPGPNTETRVAATAATGGLIFGTLPYMAPEQVRGDEADARSDVYAAGVVLFEMITGRRPFQDRSAFMITDAILHTAPAAPSSLNPEATPALDQVTMKCLTKEPSDRYNSARELAADLARLASGVQPVGVVRRPLGRRRLGLWVALAALALASVAIAAALDVGGLRSRFSAGTETPRIGSLAVLPFKNLSAETGDDYFADGMTDELISRLSKVGALRVISRTSAMSYRNSQKTLRDIARELGVDAIVEGSVLRSKDRVRINVDLVHAPTERQLWTEGYERSLRDVLALQSELAGAIVREIRITLAPEEQSELAHTRPVTPEAYELYLRGRAAYSRLTPAALEEAVSYFQRAIEKDDKYAPAYAGLADSLAQQAGRARPPSEVLPPARTAALRAIELDDRLGDGYSSLGQVKLFYDFDWPGAGEAFQTAIKLNAGSPVIHQYYGLYLASAGRLDEALQQADRAIALDPVSTAAGCIKGRLLYYARRYDEAIAEFTRTLAMAPNTAGSCAWLGYAYLQTSRLQEAIAAGEQARTASPNEAQGHAVLARAYGQLGRKAEAADVIGQLVARAGRMFVSPYNIGVAYIGRDNGNAIAALERAFAEQAGILCFLRVDPGFDPLRADPRFDALVRRIGIPVAPAQGAAR